MARNNGNNNEGSNNSNGGFNEQQFSLEEVGKLIGSSVAAAIKEYESNNSNSNNDGDYDEDEENLRRNKDGSVDKRQFNSGRGNSRREDDDDQSA